MYPSRPQRLLQRENLGWEGDDPVKSLTDCFARAIKGTYRFKPLIETQTSSSTAPPAAGAANGALRNSRKSPEKKSPDSQPSPASDKRSVMPADDCQQQPPEFSRGEGAEGGGQEGSSTLDLHYADPDIVGSWRMRLVQGGLSDGLVARWVAVATGHGWRTRAVLITEVHSSQDHILIL